MEAATLRGSARFAGRPLLRTQTDQRLVELARCGSEPAFETIVERYRRPLKRYCTRFVPASQADDVVQQTFLSAYRAMHEEGRDLSLKPWLFRVTHNAAIDTLRREAPGWDELDESCEGIERPDQAADGREGLRDLVSSLQRLPERQRAAIVLREMEGRSYEEISHALGVTDGAVRQLLARAREGLQAGATALVPIGLLLRVPGGAAGAGNAERVTELVSATGAAAGLSKICAVVAVTGAVGGVAVAPPVERPLATREDARRQLAQSTSPGLEHEPALGGSAQHGEGWRRAAGTSEGRDRQPRGDRFTRREAPADGSDEGSPAQDDGDEAGPQARDDDRDMESGAPDRDDADADPPDADPVPTAAQDPEEETEEPEPAAEVDPEGDPED